MTVFRFCRLLCQVLLGVVLLGHYHVNVFEMPPFSTTSFNQCNVCILVGINFAPCFFFTTNFSPLCFFKHYKMIKNVNKNNSLTMTILRRGSGQIIKIESIPLTLKNPKFHKLLLYREEEPLGTCSFSNFIN